MLLLGVTFQHCRPEAQDRCLPWISGRVRVRVRSGRQLGVLYISVVQAELIDCRAGSLDFFQSVLF